MVRKFEIENIVDENVNPNDIDLSILKIHDQLNPEIWLNDDTIKPEIRNILLKNAVEFIKFSNLEKFKFNDIVLTGSLANYNYTPFSDLDVHIIIDFKQIKDNLEFFKNFFDTKKELWKLKYHTTVKDHDVELYIQDLNEIHLSTGVYSLLKNKWRIKPIKSMVVIDSDMIQKKSADIMDEIDGLYNSPENENLLTKIDRLKDKIKKFRQSGLSKNGEYSIENLVFKTLRNTGYLEKLSDLKNSVQTNNLTLENLSINENNSNNDKFEKWFSNSKVVDKNGNPLMVYHATNADFNEFSEKGTRTIGRVSLDPTKETDWYSAGSLLGFWFSDKKNNLSGKIIKKAYLSLKNPFYVNNLEELVQTMMNDVAEIRDLPDDKYNVFEDINLDEKLMSELVHYWKRDGYDGIIIKNDEEMGGRSFIVFNPNQIQIITN